MIVLGVDPGGANTGIVVRKGAELLHARTVRRGGGVGRFERTDWVAMNVAALHETLNAWTVDLIGVEDVNHPSPHLGVINMSGLLDTAIVLGAVLGWLWDEHDETFQYPDHLVPTLLVPPRGHGKGPRQAYPAGCSNPHLRAAWDQAGWAADEHRIRQQLPARIR